MSKRLIWLASFVLVLGAVSSALGTLPPGWINSDVGSPMPGSADESGGVFTVTANGNDIWDNSDSFHYAYKLLDGDGECIARVLSIGGPSGNEWRKAGVMIRETLTGPSTHAYMAMTAGAAHASSFQGRTATAGGSVNNDLVPTGYSALPWWVKITRSGDNFTGSVSPDGVTWTAVATRSTVMTANVYIGLAVTSHEATLLTTCTFDSVSFTGNVHGFEKAGNPYPANNSMLDGDSVSLTWEPGESAVLHDVYFSDNFGAVNTATTSSGGVYRGRQSQLKYPPGPYTEPVVRGATYYWRIDEVAGTNVWRGDIWRFTVLSNINYNPNPADEATYVPVTTDLSWIKGNWAAKGHIVYFSTDFATVNNAVPGTVSGPGYLAPTSPQTVTSTTRTIPGDLPYNTTYYWRADAVEKIPPLAAGNTHKGTVWEFKTTLQGTQETGSIMREIWQNITPQSAALSSLYNWPDFPSNPTITDTVTSFVTDPDWDDYGGRIHGWLYAPVSGDYRFYLTTADNGELWLSTDENPANAHLIAWESDSRTLYAWASSGEEASDLIPLVGGKKYYIGALWKERDGADHCAVGWTGPGIPTITVIPGSVLMPYVRLRVVPVAVMIDPTSTTEVRTTLPDSIEAVVRGGKYYLEIWASDTGATKTGLTGVYVDVSFCGQTSASAVEHGTVFTMFTDGDIQPGGVDEFGGSALPHGGGIEPEWVRVGWIEMSADVDAETCSISLLPSTGGVATFGRGLVPWAFIDLGSVDLQIQILPPARSYNLDGDSVIGVGDLSLFAPSWQRSVPPAQNAHDFDCDCFVGVGDLSWFATGWMKSPADPTILYPPCPGGGNCGEAASMRGMTPMGFTLTSLRRMATTSSGPADVDVAFELVVLNAPSASGTTTLLPTSIGSIAQGQTYYVEVWASDVGDISTGITSAYVDLHFPAAAASVTNISHGSLFTLFPSGSVALGVIDELGGSQLSPGVGVAPQWARVAVIRMRADAVPPSVTFSLSPSSTKVAAYGRGVIDWDDIALGAASVPPKITGFVRTPRAAGLDGVLLFADSGGGSSLTDATGYYEVVVPQGWSGTITPGSAEFSLSFDPDALSYSNVMNMFINQDYIAHNICDLDGDDDVTIVDFAYFADYWLQSGAELPANFDLSDPIGYPDLEIFVNNWLWTP